VDASVLSTFVEGASKAFEVQVKMKITPGKATPKMHMFEPDDVVAGRMHVDVEGFRGSITICFGENAFKQLYKALLGEEINVVDKDSADAAGELVNIIYGHAKAVLNQTHKLQLKPAIPEIILKPKVEKIDSAVLTLPFTSEVGSFRLEIVVL